METLFKDVMQLLIQNSRYSNDEIASMLGVSSNDVSRAVDQLKKDGVIRQFTTIINTNIIKDVPIKALVELSIRPEKDTGYDAIASHIYSFPNVVSHYLVSGKYDFLVVVEGKDHKDIAQFVFEKLATIENVKSTTTHFIFKTYKDHGALMEDDAESKRIPLLP